MTRPKVYRRQHGVTLIELMVTMAITLFLVAAAAYVYLGTRQTQRAIERNSSNTEVGTFVLQLIGQDIMKAGFYPATSFRVLTASEGFPKLSRYPPLKLNENAVQVTDWTLPADPTPAQAYFPVRQSRPMGPYASGLFGCEGAKFLPATGACDTLVAGAPDSIVVNYFTNDRMRSSNDTVGANIGDGSDCTGSAVGNDASNTNRVGATGVNASAPLQPLFVSNRFGINSTQVQVEQQTVTTGSLACNGNGASGSRPNPAVAVINGTSSSANNIYQPLISGIEDLQITYGVFASTAATALLGLRTPDNFFSATQVNALDWVKIDDPLFPEEVTPPWSRVVAVRVCVMTRSLGSSPKIADKAGAARTYTDCKGATITQPASDTSLRKRFTQTFAVRNRLNQVF